MQVLKHYLEKYTSCWKNQQAFKYRIETVCNLI